MTPSRIGSRSPIDSASYSTGQEAGPGNAQRSEDRSSTPSNTQFSVLPPRSGLPPRPNPMSLSSLDNPSSSSTVSHLASHFREQDLIGAVIQRRNPQDFSGPPLPSGASIDSRVTGSTHTSRFSVTSGQYPPPSVASSSTGRVPASIEGPQRFAPYPPPSSRSSGSGPVRAPLIQSAPGQLPAVPDRGNGVKTPRGRHLKPEVKNQIKELYEEGTTSGAEIAQRIPPCVRLLVVCLS
jgi:hypothetical protein